MSNKNGKWFLPKPNEVTELVINKVEQLNADGSRTDITDQPEKWYPPMPTGKELQKLKLWYIINNHLKFHSTEKQKQ